ncbi:cytochrome P450 [Streptomyces sp. JV176]|uniref:cytochrome P450 n=1 Tax=Streptomyces sp. JV176 TaxID=858630 RepID=UPI002E780E7D|nr:cytochrome P450 [Streptomyces sp. JV176]MEE1799499.1 cytochrome P450 [Streptomyces sp. JV176]
MSRPVIDFDHRSVAYRDNWQQIARDLHSSGNPIAWSEHHGGFWVTASIDAVRQVCSDWETFTAENDLDGTSNGGRGHSIPRSPYQLYLGESDPPLHTARRRLEAPFFAPKAVREWGPVAHRYLHQAIDDVIEQGHADLIDDILVPTTARTTLYVVGYDPDDWLDAAMSAHTAVYLLPSDPKYPYAEQKRLRENFRAMLRDRRARPTGDLTSALATGLVEERQLNDDEGESMINALVFGGFDTTVALLANVFLWLNRNPGEKDRLATDDAYRRGATEEFLRFFPPATMQARTALKDTEVLGQPIKRGDTVGLWLAGANRDPKTFEDPDSLRLDRPNARDNVTFSAGNHRCLGSPLAKVEINEVLKTVLTRMPDIQVDETRVQRYPSIGTVNGFSAMPISFKPGPRGTEASGAELAG